MENDGQIMYILFGCFFFNNFKIYGSSNLLFLEMLLHGIFRL